MKAFPSDKSTFRNGLEKDIEQGMNLRDYFAAKANKWDVEPFLQEATKIAESQFPEHLGGNRWKGCGGQIYRTYERVKDIKNKLLSDSNLWVIAKFLYADAMMKARETKGGK